MMASTLADNSSRTLPASGRKREQEIRLFASTRRYDCKRLHLYLTVPTGKYDKLETINLGGNRVVYDPQIALHQGFGDHWSFDLTADMILYGHNKKAGVLGEQTLSQKTSVQAQAFVNYKWPGGLATSIGYQGFRGGKQKLDSIANGQRTEFDEMRFVASKFVTPKFQLLAEVNHQFNVDGGFRQDIGFLLRGLYVF